MEFLNLPLTGSVVGSLFGGAIFVAATIATALWRAAKRRGDTEARVLANEQRLDALEARQADSDKAEQEKLAHLELRMHAETADLKQDIRRLSDQTADIYSLLVRMAGDQAKDD